MEEYIKYAADTIELDINGEKVRKNIEDYIQDEMSELESLIGNLEKMIDDEKEKDYIDLSFQNKEQREKIILEIKEKKAIIEGKVKYVEDEIMDYIAKKRKEYPSLDSQDLVRGITTERFEKLEYIVDNFDEYKKATEEKIEKLEAESEKMPKTAYEKNKKEMAEFIKKILKDAIKEEADLDEEKRNCKWEKHIYEVTTGEEVLFVSDKFGKIEDMLKKKLEEKYGEKLLIKSDIKDFIEDVQILPAYSRELEGTIGKKLVHEYQGHEVEEFEFPKPEKNKYGEMSFSEKNKCKEEISKMEKIKNSPESKYDEPGYIDVHVKFKIPGIKLNDHEIVRIPITQRELATAGFSPEFFGWKGKVSSKDITKIGKNIPKKLIDSIKEIFDKVLKKENTSKGQITDNEDIHDFGDT